VDLANTANFGHITDGVAGHTDNFNSSHNTVTYTANATGQGTDTITVTAFLVQGQNRIQIGLPQTATVTVAPGLIPATHGPVTVPLSLNNNGDILYEGFIESYINAPNAAPSTTNPDAEFDINFQPNQGITSPSLVSTLFVARTGSETISGTPLSALQFQVNGSPQIPANSQATMTFEFLIQQPTQVPSNHEFTCSFYQGTTLLGSGPATVNTFSQLAPNGAELDCIARFVGSQNQKFGTTINTGLLLNTQYTLVESQ
jgi:hypothetical protein